MLNSFLKRMKVFIFFIASICVAYLLLFAQGLVEYRFKDGVIYSPAQIQDSMCVKWFQIPNFAKKSITSSNRLLICSALFPGKNFFDNSGYIINAFNEVNAVATFPTFVEKPLLELQDVMNAIISNCNGCIVRQRNFNGEAENQVRNGNKVSDVKDLDKVKGFFLYFTPYLPSSDIVMNERLSNKFFNFGNLAFYDNMATIVFPNSTHNEFANLSDERLKRELNHGLGEDVEAFFWKGAGYGTNFIQFVVGKSSKKVHSTTCVFMMKENKSSSNEFILSKEAIEVSRLCSRFVRNKSNLKVRIKDPTSEMPIFFFKEVNYGL